jgi:hypothetical protein
MPFVAAESADLRSSDSSAAQGHLGVTARSPTQDHGASGLTLGCRHAAVSSEPLAWFRPGPSPTGRPVCSGLLTVTRTGLKPANDDEHTPQADHPAERHGATSCAAGRTTIRPRSRAPPALTYSVPITISLPNPLAESLVDEGLAVRPLRSRAEPVAVTATLEVIGALANLTAIAASSTSIGDLSRRIVSWLRHEAPPNQTSSPSAVLTLRITTPGGSVTELAIPRGGEAATVDASTESLTQVLIRLSSDAGA